MRPLPGELTKVGESLNRIEQQIYKVLKETPWIAHNDLRRIIHNTSIGAPDMGDKDLICNWIDWMLIVARSNPKTKSDSLKPLTTLRNNLIKFKMNSHLQEINLHWLSRFMQKSYDAGQGQNTVSRAVRRLYHVMQSSLDEKIHSNDIHKHKKFSLEGVETNRKVRCTFKMLEKLETHTLVSDRLIRTRDRYIVSCMTGLRDSDLSKISRSMIMKEGRHELLAVLTQKTNKLVYIPVLPLLKKKLEEIDYTLPHISNQKYNVNLKLLFTEVFPDEMFLRQYLVGDKLHAEMSPMYKFIASHSGRLSFSSNFYELDPALLPTIQFILGHASPLQTLEYMNLNEKSMVTSFMDRYSK